MRKLRCIIGLSEARQELLERAMKKLTKPEAKAMIELGMILGANEGLGYKLHGVGEMTTSKAQQGRPVRRTYASVGSTLRCPDCGADWHKIQREHPNGTAPGVVYYCMDCHNGDYTSFKRFLPKGAEGQSKGERG